MNRRQLANAYAQVGIESAVLSASQQQLTTLLFEGVVSTLARAKIAIEKRDITAKGHLISKAIAIIDTGLLQALEPDSEDPLAANLIALFNYIIKQLMLANLHNDVEKLTLCQALLQELLDSWRQSLNQRGEKIDNV